MKELTKAFKALSDETRLKIYGLILGKPGICVCDIMEGLKMNQTGVSRNLAILKNAGLVEAERKGVWMHYRASKDNIASEEVKKAVGSHVDIAGLCACCTVTGSKKKKER